MKVLLVEDEPSIADNITYTLGTDGFECTWVATGSDAREEVAKGGIDLIVLDVGLPDCSGFDLCSEIRRDLDTPIIFLTARADEIDRVVGLEIGGDDYMVKPFSPRELSARVRAILRRTRGSSGGNGAKEEPDQASPVFQIDEGRCLIRYHGADLNLSRYEYRLLCVFIRKPGWVFSRDKLMELVWDEPEASMDRTVDAHIKSLRAKLRAVKSDVDPIKTHRGMGYALKENL
ncbi:MAG: two-component system response regulator CreB [Acidobacteriota bacterium]|nr:two-component system response regulator CreB [Acidobacteriota bacterium]